MDCVALGDSIAVGISQHSQCRKAAIVGVPSAKILTMAKNVSADTVVISAGSNDPNNPSLRGNLYNIRKSVKAKRVIWIAPYNQNAAAVVREVASYFNDGVIHLTNYASGDRVHPKNYRLLAKDALK